LFALAVDESRCNRCRRCEVACQLRAERGARGVPRIRVEEDGWPIIRICRQCEGAPCAEACVSGAIRSDPGRGTVQLDPSLCVGCWACVMECPFAAAFMTLLPDGRWQAVKCDGCSDLPVPLCARFCPTGALRWSGRAEGVAAGVRRRRAARLGRGVLR